MTALVRTAIDFDWHGDDRESTDHLATTSVNRSSLAPEGKRKPL
jgi:hypothetical protein